MMRRIVIPMLCLAVLCLAATQSQAAGLSMLFPGTVNKLEDNDWEILIIGDQDTLLEKGEVLLGMLEIQKSLQAENENIFKDPVLDTFTAIFAIQVKDVALAGANDPWIGYKYEFQPYDPTNWSTKFAALGLPDMSSANSAGAIYFDHRTSTSDPFVEVVWDDDNDPLTPEVPLPLKDSLETAWKDNTTLLWEYGWGVTGKEHWTTITNTMDMANTSLAISNYVAMNVTAYGAGPILLPHNWLGRPASTPALKYWFPDETDIQGFGGIGSGLQGPWALVTDGDWYIKPTPEPGSLALLGLGLVACAGMVYRRRKNNA